VTVWQNDFVSCPICDANLEELADGIVSVEDFSDAECPECGEELEVFFIRVPMLRAISAAPLAHDYSMEFQL
jgi:hypothetical protein